MGNYCPSSEQKASTILKFYLGGYEPFLPHGYMSITVRIGLGNATRSYTLGFLRVYDSLVELGFLEMDDSLGHNGFL